jgi:hypothetical protein
MILRFKAICNCYRSFLKKKSICNLSICMSKSNFTKNLNFERNKNTTLLKSDFRSFHKIPWITYQRDSKENYKEEINCYFWEKVIICCSIILLSFLKNLKFVECEKQSKADKEKCDIFFKKFI